MASYKLPPRGPGLTRAPEHQTANSRPMVPKVLDGNNRQTALTPEVMAKLKKELAVGDWPTMASYRAGVAPSTFFNWIRMGCLPDCVEPYSTLVGELVMIEAELSGRMMGIINAAAEDKESGGNPEQAKWVLINRFRYWWAIDKETGLNGGRAVMQEVEALMGSHNEERREKARALLASLSHEQKQAARKEGFLV